MGDNKKHIVLIVSDLHCPYVHPDAADFLRDTAKEFKPTKIIFSGDEWDWHSLSFHDKEPELYCPGREYDAALKTIQPFYKLFPKADVCISNHTARYHRVAHKAGIPSRLLLDYKQLLQAPKGWSWSQRIIVDNVCYEHGEMVSGRNGAWKAMMENKMSTVIGHLHSFGGVQYSASPFNQTFAMNVGCLIDVDSLAFAYGSKYRNKATLGCGIVIEGQSAHFIKMPTT